MPWSLLSSPSVLPLAWALWPPASTRRSTPSARPWPPKSRSRCRSASRPAELSGDIPSRERYGGQGDFPLVLSLALLTFLFRSESFSSRSRPCSPVSQRTACHRTLDVCPAILMPVLVPKGQHGSGTSGRTAILPVFS